jgi:hypothetical protein
MVDGVYGAGDGGEEMESSTWIYPSFLFTYIAPLKKQCSYPYIYIKSRNLFIIIY